MNVTRLAGGIRSPFGDVRWSDRRCGFRDCECSVAARARSTSLAGPPPSAAPGNIAPAGRPQRLTGRPDMFNSVTLSMKPSQAGDLEILTSVDEGGTLTQRTLAQRLG